MIKHVYTIALVIGCIVSANAQPTLQGDLAGVLEAGIYEVIGDCYVPADSSLQILPGTELNFTGHYQFKVYGQLDISGTVDNPVLFTTDIEQNPEGWGGLRFVDATDSSRLEFCTFEHGRAVGNTPECFGGGVYIYRSDVILDNCAFIDNTARFGGGIYSYMSVIEILSCTFTINIATERGGAIYFSDTTVNLVRSILNENSALLGGGGVYSYSGSSVISHCTFNANLADIGSSIHARWSSTLLANSIVYESLNGSAVCCEDGGYCNIEYCDFYGNSADDFEGSGFSPAVGAVLVTNSNGDSCDLFRNIYLDPLFTDPEGDSFQLMVSSPCIDAADPDNPPDPDGSIPDIGAWMFDHTGVRESENALANDHAVLCNYPNPFNQSTVISFYTTRSETVTLSVFDITGRLVNRLINRNIQAGDHQVAWNGTDSSDRLAATGTYILVLNKDSGDVARFITLIK